MGSPHGLLIANVFMCHLEEILTRDDLIPHLYKRYVDDTLARMPSTAAAVEFPITLYSLHSSLLRWSFSQLIRFPFIFF